MRVISRHDANIRRDNPVFHLLFRAIEAAGVTVDRFSPWRLLTRRYDIYHIHWPEKHMARRGRLSALLYTLAELVLMDVARWRGARVVWTAHNAKSHEGWYPRLEAWCWRASLHRVDGCLHFSRAGRDLIRARFPQLRARPHFVVPHGHYRDIYPNRGSRAGARARLDLPEDAGVFLFLGAIRGYKNVPGLIAAFRDLPGDDRRLVIAGRATPPGLAAEVTAGTESDARIRFHPDFVDEADIQLYMNAADVVVLPYSDILNSGSAMLALSFDRPVLVSDRGAMRELRERTGPDWVRLFEPPLDARDLDAALAWSRRPERPARCDCAWGDPARVAAGTIDAYRAILARG